MKPIDPNDEGVVKYQCTWTRQPPSPEWDISKLIACRETLHSRGLIGVNAAGIGYGNVSYRLKGDLFVITGSATGHLPALTENDFSLVTSFYPEQNRLICEGPASASSESMTHGVFYRLDPAVGAVVHVHHEGLWRSLLNKVPTSDPDVPYGTPEMTAEVNRLYKNSDLPQRKIMAMGGHFEGVITIGESIDTALDLLMNYFLAFSK